MAALFRHLVGATLAVSEFTWFEVWLFCSLGSVRHKQKMAEARVGYNGYQRTTNKRFTQLLQFFDNSSAWSQDFGGMKIRIAFSLRQCFDYP